MRCDCRNILGSIFLLLSLSLLLVSSVPQPVFGAEVLYSNWVYYGDTFERDGVIYAVDQASDRSKILLTVGETPYILTVGSCKESVSEEEKYCLTEAAYEDEEAYESYIKYEYGEELFGYHLVIETLMPELSVSRVITPSSSEIDKAQTITVTIENQGEKDLEYISYTENISSNLRLQTIDGRKEGRTFIYELPYLVAGQKKIFQYKVTPTDYLTASITPEVTYVYENIRKEASVSPISLTVEDPFAVTHTLSSGAAALDEDVTYTLTYENNEEDDMVVTGNLTIDDGLTVTEIDGLRPDFTFEETLKEGEAGTISFTVSAPRTGAYAISARLAALVEGAVLERQFDNQLTVSTESLEPSFTFSKSDNTLRSGESGVLRVYLTNNDPDNTFTNVQATLTGDLLSNGTISLPVGNVVAGEEKKLVKELTISVTDVEAASASTITFAGTYTTKSGEEFSFSKGLTISVQPGGPPFTITQSANTTTAARGDKIRMSVNVKNDADRYLFANIYESFSNAVEVSAGTTFAERSIDAADSIDAYLYEITIPPEFPERELTITTKAFEKGISYPTEAETVITITGEPPELDENGEIVVEDTGADGSTGDAGVAGTSGDDGAGGESATGGSGIIDDDGTVVGGEVGGGENGFFTKLWEWLTGLF